MTTSTICYKTKTPVYYNKGTKWEKTCDTFLAYPTYKSFEDAQKEAEELNKNKPATLWNKQEIDWEKVDYFFADSQEDVFRW